MLLGVVGAQTGGSVVVGDTTGTIAETVPLPTQTATGTVSTTGALEQAVPLPTQAATGVLVTTYTRTARGRTLPGVLSVSGGAAPGVPATATVTGLEATTADGRVTARGYAQIFHSPFSPRPQPPRPLPPPVVPVPATARVVGRAVWSGWGRPVAAGAACASVRGRESTTAWSRPLAVGEHLGEREDEDFLLLALL